MRRNQTTRSKQIQCGAKGTFSSNFCFKNCDCKEFYLLSQHRLDLLFKIKSNKVKWTGKKQQNKTAAAENIQRRN